MPKSRSQQGRMRFNLIKRPKLRGIPRFVVFMKKTGAKWFLKEFDDCVNTAWWTRNISAAHTFDDEEEVIDFCEMFLRNRDYNIEEVVEIN